MECIHPLVEKDHEFVCVCVFILNNNIDEYSHVKSYSSTSSIFVNMFNFRLLTSKFISFIIIFSHSFISFFGCIIVPKIVNYPTHQHSHLKYRNYIQIVF